MPENSSTRAHRRVRRASQFTLEILTQSFGSSSVEKLLTGDGKFVVFFFSCFFFSPRESEAVRRAVPNG